MELKHSENYYIRVLLKKVKIDEIMIKKVISIRIDEPFSSVPKKFKEFGIRHLPVVNDDNKLFGIITQRDLYRIQSPRKDEEGNWFYNKKSLDNYILKHVMTKDPFTLKPEDSVSKALLKMVETKYGCIPIVDKNNILCGIVTQIDILKLAAKIISE